MIRVSMLVALLGLAFAPVAFLGLLVYGPHWESSFERKSKHIQPGLTLNEVNQTIGFEGSIQTSCPGFWTGTGKTTPFVYGDTIMLWELDREEIWVGFENGKVVSVRFHDLNYL